MFFLRSDFPEPVGHKSAPILLFSVHELPPLLMLLPEKQLHLFLDTLSSIVRGRYLPGHILYRFVLVASRQWLSDVLLLILIPDCESAFACYLLLLFLLLYHISENFLPSLSGFRGAFQRSPYPGEDPEVGFKEKSRKGLNPHQVFCRILHLGCPDLVMDLAHGLAIGCSDNGGNDLFLTSHLMLNRGIHVHLLKQDEVLAALATGLHGFVLIHCFCQTGNEERRE